MTKSATMKVDDLEPGTTSNQHTADKDDYPNLDIRHNRCWCGAGYRGDCPHRQDKETTGLTSGLRLTQRASRDFGRLSFLD